MTVDELKPPDRKDGYPVQTPMWLRRVLEFLPGTHDMVFCSISFNIRTIWMGEGFCLLYFISYNILGI